MIFFAKSLDISKNTLNFASLLRRTRAFSSAGSEHLPYKQRVGGSNPSTPTKIQIPVLREATDFRAFSSAGSEHLPYKQRVGGSNPSTPTQKKAFHRGKLFLCPARPALVQQAGTGIGTQSKSIFTNSLLDGV